MHLLLVEDEAPLGDVVRRGLEATGYRVEWVRDGEAAYERAATAAYDAIVLDLLLPGLDGLSLLRALRTAGVRTPVLCLTALAAVPDRVAGLDAGADDYLVKPFAFEELLARLRALLRRPADIVVPETLSCGTLVLHPADRQAAVGNRPVEVPPREFDVLEYLMRNAGRTLPREAIVDRIWSGVVPRANVVDATVSRLRRRLRAAGWDGGIAAVAGLGYRLSPPEGAIADGPP